MEVKLFKIGNSET